MLNSDALLQELLQTFQTEAAEHLQTLNMGLLSLEVQPEEPVRRNMIQEAFRAAHSLKGAARVVGLDAIEKLSNGMENILQQSRDTGVHLAADTYDILYDVLDAIGLLLENKSVDVEPLLSRLSGALAPAGSPEPTRETQPVNPAPPMVRETTLVPVVTADSSAAADEPAARSSVPVSAEETIRVSVGKLDNLMAQVGELLVSKMNAEQRAGEMQEIRQHMTGWAQFWRELKLILPQIDGDIGKQLAEVTARYQDQFQMAAQDVNQLDQSLRQDSRRLGILVSQLQDNVRRVRLVPFETIVPGLQRTVRDAAHSESKQVVFQVIGGEVELDKKVLEALKDPFLHMLRNAVSHGIEAPAVREARGKPVEGQITLTLQQRGVEVHITIRDDGAGFDLDGLRHTRPNDGRADDRADQKDIIELAFLPGVTTSPEVTALSGRGVGLDVVRQRLEALQGRVEVDSTTGKGASIHLVVPITLAISRGLLVRVGDECYGLPLLSVLKIIEPQDSFTVEGQAFVTVDGATLPLVELATILNRPVLPDNSQRQLIVIIAVAEQRRALLVDDVLTEQELSVKPLGKPLHRVRNIAGTALLSDGRPVVILNAADLVRTTKAGRGGALKAVEPEVTRHTVHILVVDDSITTRTLEKNILETAGFTVTTALDGEQALLRLQESPIDLVVSDVQMPNMDGIDLTRTIRESDAFKDMPIILVTSLESPEDRERGMVAGADAYIVKRGFDQAELLKTIQQLVYVEE